MEGFSVSFSGLKLSHIPYGISSRTFLMEVAQIVLSYGGNIESAENNSRGCTIVVSGVRSDTTFKGTKVTIEKTLTDLSAQYGGTIIGMGTLG